MATGIFYGPGMFGSTIEYVLSNMQNLKALNASSITEDGSLHSFKKTAHIWEEESVASINKLPSHSIPTVIYPNNTQHLPDILGSIATQQSKNNILIYSKNTQDSELNLLFQYYKISLGCSPGHEPQGLSNFSNNVQFKQWNSNYTHWQDMQTWEWREWFSLYYPDWISEWEESQHCVPVHWLKLSNRDILTDFEKIIRKMCQYCNIKIPIKLAESVTTFADAWTSAQQYIVDEYDTIHRIVASIEVDSYYTWNNNTLSIISEAILQKTLKQKGYELKCQDLNTFPTNTKDLHSLLYRVTI